MSLIAGSGVALASDGVMPDDGSGATENASAEAENTRTTEEERPEDSTESAADALESGNDDSASWRYIRGAEMWGEDPFADNVREILPADLTISSQVNRGIDLLLEDSSTGKTGRKWLFPLAEADTIAAPFGTFDVKVVLSCYRYKDEDQKTTISLGQTITLDEAHPAADLVIPASVLDNDPCANIHGTVSNLVPGYGVDVDLWVKNTSGEFGFFDKTVSVLNNEYGFESLAPGEYQLRVTRAWPEDNNAPIRPKALDGYRPAISNDEAAARYAEPYCPFSQVVNIETGKVTPANIALDASCAIPLPEANPVMSGAPAAGETLTAEVAGLNPADYDSVKYYWYVQRTVDEFVGISNENSTITRKASAYLSNGKSSKTLPLWEDHAGRMVRVVVEVTKDGRTGYMLSTPVTVAGEINHDYDEPESSNYPVVEASIESVGQGGVVEFVATGFLPGEPVTFVVHSDPVTVGTVPADGSGRAVISWAVPAGFELGDHTVIATGGKSGRESRDYFKVRSASVSGNLWSWLAGLGSGSSSTDGGTGSSSVAGATTGAIAGTSSSTAPQTAGDAGKDGTVASTGVDADSDAKVSVKVVTKGMPVTGADATTVVALSALLLAAGAGLTLRRVNR